MFSWFSWVVPFVCLCYSPKNKKGRGDVSTFKAGAHASIRPFLYVAHIFDMDTKFWIQVSERKIKIDYCPRVWFWKMIWPVHTMNDLGL